MGVVSDMLRTPMMPATATTKSMASKVNPDSFFKRMTQIYQSDNSSPLTELLISLNEAEPATPALPTILKLT